MSILVSFNRNLVFFGVADVFLAGLALWGFTESINKNDNACHRLMGFLILIVALVALVVVNGIAYERYVGYKLA